MTTTPRPAPELVTVVIAVKNGAATIEEQLEALAAQSYDGAWEVVVADNGSTDATKTIVGTWTDRLPGLRIVDASDRPGVAHARNVGAGAARGDFIVMCDADDVAAPGWLAAMAAAARTGDVVGGQLDDDALNDPATRSWRSGHPKGQLPVAFEFLPYAVTANIGVHRDVLRDIGGWRSDYLDGAEDVEFSWRAQLRSYELIFAPDAVVRYRYRPEVWHVARQAHHWGLSHVQLYRDYREHGVRTRPPQVVASVWFRILTRWPLGLVFRQRRAAWLRTTAFNLGLVRGSIRYRVLCF